VSGGLRRRASVSVSGSKAGEKVSYRGTPIYYALAIPKTAQSREEAAAFAAFLLGDEVKGILAAEGITVLERPKLIGGALPAVPDALCVPLEGGAAR